MATGFNKYWRVFLTSWEMGLAYRTSVLLWRLRQFLSSLMALTVWTVLYSNQGSLFSYPKEELIAYIFLVSVLQSIILSTILHGLASEIYTGGLSKLLLKPINLFAYFFSFDMADKLKNLLFSGIEISLLYLIFQPQLLLPSAPFALAFLLSTFGAILLFFCIELLFAALGFWSPETWAPRFLFYLAIEFTAGKLYPLDILPQGIQSLLSLTPFPYLSFMQIQIFMERLSLAEVWQHLGIQSLWLLILAALVHFIWKKGLRDYQAPGS